MDEIYYGKDQWALVSLPPVANGHSHTVLYELPLDLKSTSPPKPHFGQMKWDSSHVRLPCSTQNEYVFSDEVIFFLWSIIFIVLMGSINQHISGESNHSNV